jgi:chromosome segregation ATPase
MSSYQTPVPVTQTIRANQAGTDSLREARQKAAADLRAQKARVRTNDRRVQAKAAYQRLKDEIKAKKKAAKLQARIQEHARHIDEIKAKKKAAELQARIQEHARHIDEESDSDEDVVEDLDIHKERVGNRCVNLSSFGLLLVVFNLILWQYYLTRQV